MLTWGRDDDLIGSRIAHPHADLKILLKTKDDHALLGRWIEHHSGLVGAANIVIADNGSTDARTLAIYEHMDPAVVLFRFEGDHNEIHSPSRFPALHRALDAGALWSAMIDTDEFLFRRRGLRLDSDVRMHDLPDRAETSYPATYLYGVPGRLDAVKAPGSRAAFLSNVLWGKPLIRAGSRDPLRSCNHNVQFDPDLFSPRSLHAFVLVHHDRFSAEQRMTNNRNKLAARGLVDSTASFEEVARLDVPDAYRAGAGRWVTEMRELLEDAAQQEVRPDALQVGIRDDGRLEPVGSRGLGRLRRYFDMRPDLVLDALVRGHRKWRHTA